MKKRMGRKKRKIILNIEFENYPFSSMKNGNELEAQILSVLKDALNEDRLIIKEVESSNADELEVETIVLK